MTALLLLYSLSVPLPVDLPGFMQAIPAGMQMEIARMREERDRDKALAEK